MNAGYTSDRFVKPNLGTYRSYCTISRCYSQSSSVYCKMLLLTNISSQGNMRFICLYFWCVLIFHRAHLNNNLHDSDRKVRLG